MTENFNAVIDVRGENSPIPMIRTKETLDFLSVGSILKVIVNKETAVKNTRTLIKNNPFSLLAQIDNKEEVIFFLQKNSS